MKRNFKKLAVFLAVMIITLSFASSGFAANTVANLKATYRNITVYKNGILFNFSKEPFIVDGTTYVPLRDMAEMVDKDVTWDGVNYKIGVNDKPGQSANELYQQIFTLQQELTRLQDENKKLKEAKDASVDLDDLEDDLNEDHNRIGKKLYINEIKLKGDEDDIEVRVYFSTKKDADYDAWKALDDDDKEDYLQDIVDDILKVYKKADISGYMEDEYEKDKIKFSVSSKGKVSLGSSSSSGSYDIDDLEDDLNDDFDEYKGVDFKITLSGKKSSITVKIVADVKDITKELSKTQMSNYLEDIYEAIIDEFNDASVKGYIKDDIGELDFEFDSDGDLDLDW
jgi:uncharacterized small protein (DUF1192 family)